MFSGQVTNYTTGQQKPCADVLGVSCQKCVKKNYYEDRKFHFIKYQQFQECCKLLKTVNTKMTIA